VLVGRVVVLRGRADGGCIRDIYKRRPILAGNAGDGGCWRSCPGGAARREYKGRLAGRSTYLWGAARAPIGGADARAGYIRLGGGGDAVLGTQPAGRWVVGRALRARLFAEGGGGGFRPGVGNRLTLYVGAEKIFVGGHIFDPLL